MIITSYRELRVYRQSIDNAMEIFKITKSFAETEKYSMVDQIRKSSRSVCANIAEAWRKRRYKAAFIAKINDAETEACETQVWLEMAYKCGYISQQTLKQLDISYEQIMGQLVIMIHQADKWTIK
jgi:four helix bundle protein